MIDEIIRYFEQGKIKSLTKKDSPMNIQIIPNVKRIKIEKVAAAKEIFKQHQEAQGEGKAQKVPDLTLATDEMLEATINLDQVKTLPAHSYYYENVFSLEDLYLFQSVFYFYAGDYQRAIDGYLHCQFIKNQEAESGKMMQ